MSFNLTKGAVYTALGAAAPVICSVFNMMGFPTTMESSAITYLTPLLGAALGGGVSLAAFRADPRKSDGGKPVVPRGRRHVDRDVWDEEYW